MRPVLRFSSLGAAASVALLAAGDPAVAAPKPITGKLTKPGYTLLALAENGEVTTVAPGTKRFRLVPPAKRITLHLRARDGTYAGPVVLAERERARNEVRSAKRKVRRAQRSFRRARRTGEELRKATRQLRKARSRLRAARRLLRGTRTRAIVGVRAGAQLGRIRVRRGYAKLSKPLRKRWVDRSRFARARREVPIGAGYFGHVRSASGRAAVPGDADRDGIPDVLDVDDDGDLILDALDDSPAKSALASQVGPYPGNPCAPNPFCAGSNLFVPATATANSHIGSGDPAINTRLRQFGNLSLTILRGGPVELDCGGEHQQPRRPEALIYCRPHTSGGTGIVSGAAFPDCCDSEDSPDGLGTMVSNAVPASPPVMAMKHSAPSEEIAKGDILLQRVATSGDVSDCPPPGGMDSPACTSFPLTLSFVFHAPPALFAYTPEGGSSTPVQYPITGPLTVRDADGDGDVEVTLTFFRPQRRPTPAEPGHGQTGAWMDVGGLAYGVPVEFVAGSGGTGRSCPQDAFTENDDELGPRTPAPSTPGGLVDSAPDRPASTADTLSFTLDITKCIGGATWNPGQDVGLGFRASKAGSLTDQSGVIFRRGS